MLGRASVVFSRCSRRQPNLFDARTPVEWPRFRGPNGSGVAEGNSQPTTFGPSEKLLWKTAVPPGHSSPVVWTSTFSLRLSTASSSSHWHLAEETARRCGAAWRRRRMGILA